MDTSALRTLPLFEGTPNDELERCAALFQEREFLAGSSLASQGDFAYKFFVVLDGEVDVHRDFDLVATLGPGEVFGERGVVTGERRDARVTARTRAVLAWMMIWDFKTMTEDNPVIAERIEAVIAARGTGD
jgi:CRP-like cAMP-binding protein